MFQKQYHAEDSETNRVTIVNIHMEQHELVEKFAQQIQTGTNNAFFYLRIYSWTMKAIEGCNFITINSVTILAILAILGSDVTVWSTAFIGGIGSVVKIFSMFSNTRKNIESSERDLKAWCDLQILLQEIMLKPDMNVKIRNQIETQITRGIHTLQIMAIIPGKLNLVIKDKVGQSKMSDIQEEQNKKEMNRALRKIDDKKKRKQIQNIGLERAQDIANRIHNQNADYDDNILSKLYMSDYSMASVLFEENVLDSVISKASQGQSDIRLTRLATLGELDSESDVFDEMELSEIITNGR
jgi:hypothetical protein